MPAVIFDLFETLVTEWGKPKYAVSMIAADLGVDYHDFQRAKQALSTAHFLGKFPGTTQYLEVILAILNTVRDESLLVQAAQKRENYKRACFDVIEPQILDMLTQLKKSGYKLGLISNCSPEEIKGFYSSDLYQYSDAVVMSCDVGLVKPDVEIYQHCLSLLNEKPDNCFFVGDGGSDELNGAKNAGLTPIRAVWFTKHFAKLSDNDLMETFPTAFETSDILQFIK